MTVTFAVTAIAYGALALSALSVARTIAEHAISVAILVAAMGLAGVAFSADGPDATVESWHAHIHNSAYPLIPLGVVAAMTLAAMDPVTMGTTGSRAPSQGAFASLGRPSRLLAPIAIVAFSLTAVSQIAQLARYFAFAALLVWAASFSWRQTGAG